MAKSPREKTPDSMLHSPALALRLARAIALVGLPLLSGCAPGPLQFELNMEGRDPATVSRSQAEAIEETLIELFGTPSEPRVPEGVDLDLELIRRAAGPIRSDEQGVQYGLYRQHCVTCHGLEGSGAGPAAAVLSPYPRDFRPGLFKYTSTAGGAKPVDDDLERTLLRGVPGTAMPSFAMLKPGEIDALIEYVKYLSIRGETELALFSVVVDEDEYLPLDEEIVEEDCLLPMADMWARATERAISEEEALSHAPPTDTPEQLAASVARGRELYLAKGSKCVDCHGREGDGKGEEPELYDEWNKSKKGMTPEQTAELAKWFTLPIQELHPRNFREGVFHGGGRPVDLYWRIHVGIKGTAMPAAGPGPHADGILTPEEIWDVVSYVLSLAE